MITYEGEDDAGIHVRITIDPADPEHAYLYTRGTPEHDTWTRPLELTVVP